jgi:hypothetical protein
VQPTDAARDFFRGLLPWAGVEPELLVEGDVEMRWLESGRDRIVFVFNHGEKPEKARIVLPGAWDLRDLGGSAIEDVNILVPPNGVWIAVAKRAGR